MSTAGNKNYKGAGLFLIIEGIVIAAFALCIDILGLGGHPDVFGWKQIALLIAGVFMTAVGVAFILFAYKVGQ